MEYYKNDQCVTGAKMTFDHFVKGEVTCVILETDPASRVLNILVDGKETIVRKDYIRNVRIETK